MTTLFNKSSIIVGVITIVIIITGFYYFSPLKKQTDKDEEAKSNISEIVQNAQDSQRNFLFEEGMVDLHLKGVQLGIFSDDNVIQSCVEQQEYGILVKKNFEDLTTIDLQRLVALHSSCGYGKGLRTQRENDVLDEEVSKLFGVIPPITDIQKKELANQIAGHWREIISLRKEEDTNSKLYLDSKQQIWNTLLQNKKGEVSSDIVTSQIDEIVTEWDGILLRRKEITSEVDSLVSKKNDLLAQYKVGLVLSNTNSE